MKKFVTVLLVAILAVSCICVLAACNKPLENADAMYLLAGGIPGWGVDDPTDESVKNRVMEPISVNDKRVASIKDQLTDVKYLYVVEYEISGEAGWKQDFKPTADAEATEIDGAVLVKVIKYVEQSAGDESEWIPTWHCSKECGGQVKSLTPDTLWEPPYIENLDYGVTDGGSYQGWNSNAVLLKGVGKYIFVFAEFNNGTFGFGAIEIAN